MASHTKELMTKRAWHKTNQGKKRKAKERKHSTPSAKELFAGCGEPGKPAK
jgi:hypothetical protein